MPTVKQGGSRPRVVAWLNMPTPYFVNRFNAVADLGDVDLEVWFNEEREADRSWRVDEGDWRFRARWIPERSLLGWRQHLPIAELRAARPDLFLQEYHRVNLALALPPARLFARRTAVRLLPNFDMVAERTWWRELGKHFLFRTFDGGKVPGPGGAALGERYGLPRDRMVTVTQAIDHDHYATARRISAGDRERGRERLGLQGCAFVYVGRLTAPKGVDHLIEAFRTVHSGRPDSSLLLVGDGVDEDRYRRMAEGLPVVFAGFHDAPELPALYGLADVMVFPTLGDAHGLVVEEAMAAGLPVISTESAGDIRLRLPEGGAGYVVPPADADALAERMSLLVEDADLRARLAADAPGLVTVGSHEDYAEQFGDFVLAVLAKPERHTFSALVTARALGAGMALLAAKEEVSPALSVPDRGGE